MQNRDGGWGAFDKDNDKLWLNRIPFSDMDSLCDPSTADVPGRVLEAFGMMRNSPHHRLVSIDLLDRVTQASKREIVYLASTQEQTGSWYGRWGVNYIYGTSNVLCGLAYCCIELDDVQDMVRSAIQWLKLCQNPDGGWGEDLLSYKKPSGAGCGISTPSQTAWAVMELLAHLPPTDTATRKGVDWLIRSQTTAKDDGATWPETRYTGTGFPKHFYIGYSLYPHYSPMMALGRYVQAMEQLEG
jgi:squalene-hopene/tetraprenyl-beta-curcumene cyclase